MKYAFFFLEKSILIKTSTKKNNLIRRIGNNFTNKVVSRNEKTVLLLPSKAFALLGIAQTMSLLVSLKKLLNSPELG